MTLRATFEQIEICNVIEKQTIPSSGSVGDPDRLADNPNPEYGRDPGRDPGRLFFELKRSVVW